MATATAMDRRMFNVCKNWARFSNYLASVSASAHSEVFQKERKNRPSICATNTNMQIEYTNKKMVILYACLRIGAKKSPFLQNEYEGKGKLPLCIFFCSCTICFAVVPCILQLCLFFCRCAKKIKYYSYVQFCWCANEIAVLLCIMQLYIQFVSCELFLQLWEPRKLNEKTQN
jgi:hypothetical protein